MNGHDVVLTDQMLVQGAVSRHLPTVQEAGQALAALIRREGHFRVYPVRTNSLPVVVEGGRYGTNLLEVVSFCAKFPISKNHGSTDRVRTLKLQNTNLLLF